MVPTNPQTKQISDQLWTNLLQDVANGVTTVKQGVQVLKAVTTAINDVNTLVHGSLIESVAANFPDVVPLLSSLGSRLGIASILPTIGLGALLITPPGLAVTGAVVGVLALMAVSHGMPPGSEDEKRWFDRASGGPSAAR